MKVRLLESAHDTWAPAGTVGELKYMPDVLGKPIYRFYPDHQNKPLLFKSHDGGLWIGRVKWEEVSHGTMETEHGPVPVFVEDSADNIQVAVANALVKPRKRGK